MGKTRNMFLFIFLFSSAMLSSVHGSLHPLHLPPPPPEPEQQEFEALNMEYVEDYGPEGPLEESSDIVPSSRQPLEIHVVYEGQGYFSSGTGFGLGYPLGTYGLGYQYPSLYPGLYAKYQRASRLTSADEVTDNSLLTNTEHPGVSDNSRLTASEHPSYSRLTNTEHSGVSEHQSFSRLTNTEHSGVSEHPSYSRLTNTEHSGVSDHPSYSRLTNTEHP